MLIFGGTGAGQTDATKGIIDIRYESKWYRSAKILPIIRRIRKLSLSNKVKIEDEEALLDIFAAATNLKEVEIRFEAFINHNAQSLFKRIITVIQMHP